MFNADTRTLQRMAPLMQRVLIVDAQAAPVRLLTDLLRDIAPCQVWTAADARRGMQLAEQVNPHIVFVEQNPAIDGAAFTRFLRRSNAACRKAPVIMVTAEATAATILGARDAGVHEFLRKPFTIKDLMRRLEAVTLRSRDWVEAVNYVGPDRRRFNSGDYSGPLKRQADTPPTPDAARIVQALKIFKAAVAAIDTDRLQALRAMQAQLVELREAAVAVSNPALAAAAKGVETSLSQVDAMTLKRPDLEGHLAALWSFMPEGGAGEASAAA